MTSEKNGKWKEQYLQEDYEAGEKKRKKYEDNER